jgi:hypothetical protein
MSRYVWLGVGAAALLVVGLFKLINSDRVDDERAALANSVEPAAVAVATVTASAVAKPVADSTEKHILQVFSPYPLWLRVTAKDRTFEGFIAESSTWTWRGEGAFSIRLGHSKQVHLSFDGRDVPLEENQKKVDLPG